MCGITGIISASNYNSDSLKRIVTSMCNAILHRGPDDSGIWVDAAAQVALGHRRLSIIDLSAHGHQPMMSNCGRYVLAFNGEIYNHRLIRETLENEGNLVAPWRGNSDTESLLAGFASWGLEATLQRAIGMFAIAVWDRELNTLTLARDRLGEKPLYYGWQGQGQGAVFLFGSELSALRRHPKFSANINRNALMLYMRHNCIGGASSIYCGISKLLPGHMLTVSSTAPEPVLRAWWSAENVAAHGVAQPFKGSPEDAVAALEILLRDAVGQQMMADVPLGAFLSGGIDSSTIVALMQSLSSRPIKTFTIGFNEEGFNEAMHAKAVAKYLGTDHTELYVSPTQAMDIIPKLPSLYCEPFADSSQIPTYLVSQLAKQKVTVSLSGDAGDELFCGYNRYKLTSQLWRRLSLIPTPMREVVSKLITSISPAAWDKLGALIPGGASYTSFGDKIHKGAGVLASADLKNLYLGMISQISNPSEWVIGGLESPEKLISNAPLFAEFNGVEKMMLLDTISYLPDDILAKVDRAAMGVSLEGRVPFLDHRIFEFAWALPLDYKLRDGQTKWPLRQILYRYVPKELIERPKMGFGVPIGDWLRGPLRGWAETLLSEDRLKREGFFYPGIIRAKWAEHLSGKRNWQSQLWTVLMFQAWLEENNR